MMTINVNVGVGYDVMIGEGLIARCGELIARRAGLGATRAAVVADDSVARLYGETARASIEGAGLAVSTIVFPHGEASKDLATFARVTDGLAEAGLSRKDIVVALGGGVTGDLAGFAAACWMRGVRCVQIPTSLLAMIDSSVGGKTAVDISAGKNLCGAFHQPSLVLCDTSALATLPPAFVADGLGEMIKYGMGFDADILDAIIKERNVSDEMIARCVEIKARVVEADEFEGGERRKLNLGHTAAHAIERLSNFGISHGRAVAIGTRLVARAQERRGELPHEALDRLDAALDACGLARACPYDAGDLARAAFMDKKRAGGSITLVLPVAAGECVLREIPVDELEGYLADGIDRASPPRALARRGVRVMPGGLSGAIPAITSKSDAHRMLICAALADAPTTVRVESTNNDIDATAACLEALGATIDRDGSEWRVSPISGTGSERLDCRESGSTLRFLLPVVPALGLTREMTGCGRLPERPLSPLLEELERHGVSFSASSMPFTISGRLAPGDFILPGNVSSQYISGLLFALPALDGESRILLTSPAESRGYIDMTIRTLERFGIDVRHIEDGWTVRGGQRFRSPGSVVCDGDWSSAAFFLAAGALTETGLSVEVGGLDLSSAQGDRAVADILRALGALVSTGGDGAGEWVRIGPRALGGTVIDARDIPDLVPILSVVAASASGETRITNAARLRLKESDRLRTTAAMIRALGGDCDELDDGLAIRGGLLSGGVVDCAGDHRIAMAAAIAATVCAGPVILDGAEACEKSYPSFFDDFKKLGGNIENI